MIRHMREIQFEYWCSIQVGPVLHKHRTIARCYSFIRVTSARPSELAPAISFRAKTGRPRYVRLHQISLITSHRRMRCFPSEASWWHGKMLHNSWSYGYVVLHIGDAKWNLLFALATSANFDRYLVRLIQVPGTCPQIESGRVISSAILKGL